MSSMRMSIVALASRPPYWQVVKGQKAPQPVAKVNTAPTTADMTIDVSQSLLFTGKLDATDAEGGLTL